MAKSIVPRTTETAFDLVHDKLLQLTMSVSSNMDEFVENRSRMAKLRAKGIAKNTQLYAQSPKKFIQKVEDVRRGHEHRRLRKRQRDIWRQTTLVMRHVDRLLGKIEEGV